MKGIFLCFFFIFIFGKWTENLNTELSYGERKAWIYFKDKDFQQNHLLILTKLNPKTIERRKLSNHPLLSEHDYPINNLYIKKVLEITNSKNYQESLWFNAITLRITKDEMKKISELDFVRSIDLVHTFKKEYVETPSFDSLQNPNYIYGMSRQQLNQMNIINLHQAGFTGLNRTVLVIDSGFRLTHSCFSKVKILDTFDFINNRKEVDNMPNDHPDQYKHGTRVLSLLSCNLNGTFMGVAPDASFLLAKTEIIDKELPIEEDYFVRAVEWGESKGAQILSSSLGYDQWYTRQQMDGKTAVTTKILNYAIRKGMSCVISAGNSGVKGITAPADSFYTIAVGAVDANNVVTSFSSRGPTADGRIKPDVMALGYNVLTADIFDNNAFSMASGTSFSAPIVAGIVTLISQKNPKWRPYDIYHSLISTSSNTQNPNNEYGYGTADALKAAFLNITGFNGCNANCSINGACYNNMCYCYTNFNGPSCENQNLDCQSTCQHGKCNEKKKCICNDGWMGINCDVFSFLIFALTTSGIFIYFSILLCVCLCICICIGCIAFFICRYSYEKNKRAAVSIELNDRDFHDQPLFEIEDAKLLNTKNEILERDFKGTFELEDEEEGSNIN